jgi:putative RecB family exonuclease
VGPVTVEAPPTAPLHGVALSPSRASDFMTCPLLYRFRTVDRLPERPSPEAVRGTLVHAVLERLFELPAPRRSVGAAAALVGPAWADLSAAEPGLAAMFASGEELAGWLASARELVAAYFALEDPTRLEPAGREQYVEVTLDSGLRLRGYVDRLDRAATGELRIVDYKTGRAPDPLFEARALFQMRFYALVLWRTSGLVPAMLQLIYLADGQLLRYSPDEAELRATERKVEALAAAIERAFAGRDFRARPGRLCDWCDHRALCPAWGGTPPPFPADADVPLLAAGPAPGPAIDPVTG